MFIKRKRMEEMEDRICEQSILIQHQEAQLEEKDREIRSLREKLSRLSTQYEEMERRSTDEDLASVPKILDEWLNGKRGEK